MKRKNEHIVPYDLLIRYLNGDLSESEKQAARNWIDQGPENKETYEELVRTWDSLDQVSDIADIDLDLEWERQKRESGITEGSQHHKGKHHFWNLSKVAAVFIMLIAASAVIYYFGPSFGITRVVTDAESKIVELPDGTMVSLNHDTELEYPRWFSQNRRYVKLTGEAYFEVRPDADKPFRVTTRDAFIQVIGTEFNVEAYDKDQEVEVTVAEGVVSFSHTPAPDDRVILEKGEQGILIRSSGALFEQKNNDPNFMAWKTRKIVFSDQDLMSVVSTLEDVYDTTIILQDPELNQCRITVSFRDQSLESVLEVISATLGIEIGKDGNRYMVSGTCQ